MGESAAKRLILGLDEQDPERHARPGTRSRSSDQPVSPLADGDSDDENEPPGIQSESETETIDYRDDDLDDHDDFDHDNADSNTVRLVRMESELKKTIEEGDDAQTVPHYMPENGTNPGDEPVDDVDHEDAIRQASVHTRVAGSPIAVELSPEMSKLLVPLDGEELPPLSGETEHYTVWCNPNGIIRAVVERGQNILTLDEARAHSKECDRTMLDELTRWLNLGAFERCPRKHATHVIDARWVLNWKEVNGRRIIQARLVVRGFKDLQAAKLSTFAGTTTRWGQRLVNSVAAQQGWPLFSADVSQAFLQGPTFEQAAKTKDELQRGVQFSVPPGSAQILQRLPGFESLSGSPPSAARRLRPQGRPTPLEHSPAKGVAGSWAVGVTVRSAALCVARC